MSPEFAQFGLDPKLLCGVQELAYETLTPIQVQVIPPALAGSDLVGLAQTGTGKTAAYALPILQRFLSSGRCDMPQALILVPTRELADQIRDEFNGLGRHTGAHILAIYGGVSINPQIARLREGVDIVIACPGRLLDHLRRGTLALSAIQMLVIDEVDRLLDMGFLPDVREIVRQTPAQRQTLLFSATMPQEIVSLANDVTRSPQRIAIQANEPVDTVSHTFFPIAERRKTDLLIEIMYREQHEIQSTLVFYEHKTTRPDGKRSFSRIRAQSPDARRGSDAVPQTPRD